MRKGKWKNIVAFLVACAVVLSCLTAGCGSNSSSADPEQKAAEPRTTVVVWTWDETFNVKAARMAEEEYEKEHPEVDIVVETREREEILSEVRNLLAAKMYSDLPDVIMMEDYDVQSVLASCSSEFVDLTDLVDFDRFADYKVELCSRDGRQYGIPFDSGATALFYRADILKQAGYSEEDMQNLTWDRYIEIGEDVLEKTGIPMLTVDPTDLPLIRLIMQSEGKWYVKEDGATADISGNEALRCGLQVFERLIDTGIGKSANGWNEFISAFQNGEVASVISGSWIVSSIEEAEDQSGRWRAAAIPMLETDGRTAASNLGGSDWYILKNGHEPETAADYVVTMFGQNDAFVDELIREIGLIPAVKDPTVYRNYEEEDDFFGGQKVTEYLTGLAAEIPTVNYGSKTYEIEEILEDEFQNMLVDGNIDQCLERVQLKADAVVRE